MSTHISFTDIGQFRNVIKAVTDHARYKGKDEKGDPIFDPTIALPVITFTGTTKIHGTNSGICLQNDEIWVQSRERVITPTSDNNGFAQFVYKNQDIFKTMLVDIRNKYNASIEDIITIFGEWAGKGIQKSVAIAEVDKLFIIFAVKISKKNEEGNYDGSYYPCDNIRSTENRIFNIKDYPTFTIDIDFSLPQLAQNKLVEITEQVEKECPVGKAFGVSGVGEGVVWEGWHNDQRHIFKVKGEKHSISKVKTLAPVDTEVLESIQKFVDYALTENRLTQGLQKVFPDGNLDITKMGEFLKWIMGDIAKEELDVIVNNNLEIKQVAKPVSNKARLWFMEQLNKGVGL